MTSTVENLEERLRDVMDERDAAVASVRWLERERDELRAKVTGLETFIQTLNAMLKALDEPVYSGREAKRVRR